MGIGLIGCADIALRRVLPEVAACPDTVLVAVASRTPEKAEAVAGRYGCRAVRGYAELLDIPEVSAVYVPLPAALHAEWVEAALRAGKHVLAEKPLTTDARRSRELLELARSKGLALMENIMFLHHAQHRAVRGLVREGAIGEVLSLSAAFTLPRRRADDIRYRRELDGGALWDVGIYPIRAAMHFIGSDLHVLGASLTQDEDLGVDTDGAALLRHRGGVTAQLSFGFDQAFQSAYTLRGSEGRIVADDAFTPPSGLRPRVRIATRTGAEHRIALDKDNQVRNTLTAFVRSVRARTEPGDAIVRLADLTAAVREAATR
ncbi:Gfo/Idh/MocA family protein [Streptomyces sp. PTY087I2]|uniref:Gfo/Idh/MocA family protein n=1 Tax=Streptomyces sp. PTY087I2 TaxID=1819298 RepID=UPI0008275AC3|nr:Gfo/Idh/MocA family oxidoreductase [Streptomyces sp. PTY087I2]OCC10571.1 1,5-anhydro-D-fructose reductase [Streptomyces sp. PTY087I2]